MLYGGLASTEIRARLAKILKEITPEEITGFIFPTSGSDANEAAIRMARRYTGRHKIINRYRSYHGGATGTLTATGDFRRWFAEAGATGFVKMYDFEPYSF